MEGSSDSVVEDPLVLQVKKSGRPRKYSSSEEAKEAKLRKDRENYEKRMEGKERKPRGRKATLTIEELRENQRTRYHRRKKLKEEIEKE